VGGGWGVGRWAGLEGGGVDDPMEAVTGYDEAFS
jgi:hypothetical protein